MPQDLCIEYQRGLDAALAELKAVQMDAAPLNSAAGAVPATPVQGGDMGRRFYVAIGRLEAAQRSYRAAVRALAECQGNPE